MINRALVMVLRFLMRYLANNEHLINKLAESRPVRRAAQLVVAVLARASSMSGTHRLPSDAKEFGTQLKSIVRKFASNVKEEIQDARDKLKKN